MFRRICIVLLMVLVLPLSPAAADESLYAILQGVRKHYGSLPGLSLTYERGIITKTMAMMGDQMKSDFATGRISFKPPHFLRIEQETPAPESVISDGNTLWWYIPKKNEVWRYKSSQLGKELRLLGDVFQGLRGVEERFMVVLADQEDKDRYRLELTPKPPWPDVSQILLTILREDYRITVLEIHNYIGGLTRFTLGPPEARKDFERGFFEFEPPQGAKVIEGEG
jgi:outer membrane lipoprotein-sorting protein